MRGTELELMHYASENYDPVKAHEYYIRNRELAGKRNEGLSSESIQKQSEASSYVRNQISTKRQAELDAQQTKVTSRLETVQKNAQAAADRIRKKLEDYLASLDTQMKVPTNASPKVRAFLERQHAKQKASAKRATVAELNKLGQNLRTAISVARSEYAAARKATVEKYDTMQKTEDENIRNEVR